MACRLGCVIAAALGSGAWARDVCAPVTEVRPVGNFTGVHANDGITVRAVVRENANAPLTLSANANELSWVHSEVDGQGTLVLGLIPGYTSNCVTAEISLPKALSYVGASNSAEVIADAAAGTLQASLGGEVVVRHLEQEALGVFAETRGEVTVGSGAVGRLYVSCASRSTVLLGKLTAQEALISATFKAFVSGLTVASAHLSLAGDSAVALTAGKVVGVVCSSSEVDINGSASMSTYYAWRCTVKRNGTRVNEAIFP